MNAAHMQPFWDVLLVLWVCSSRILGFCSTSIFFSSQYVTGTVRRAVIVALSLPLLPCFYEKGLALVATQSAFVFFIAIKEVCLGALLGWLSNFIFYAGQSVGFLIDTQRGASMASMLDPLSNSQTSPLGDFLLKFIMTLALLSGAFLGFMKVIYWSYEQVPLFGMFDFTKIDGITFFNGHMGGQLFTLIALLGGPIFFILFLSEFGLGLVTRFAPQLNVFFLSMPIKSELAMFFFILYLSYLMRYFCTHFEVHNFATQFLNLLTQP